MEQQEYNSKQMLAWLESDEGTQKVFLRSKVGFVRLFASNEESIIEDETTALSIALKYISVGYELWHQEDIDSAKLALNKGATLLNYVIEQSEDKTTLQTYRLVASIAFHIASHYSKSFVVMSKADMTEPLANILSLFLKRKFNDVIAASTSIILNTNNRVEETSDFTEFGDLVYLREISRSLCMMIFYLRRNDEELHKRSLLILNTIEEIASLRNDVDIWWLVRLLKCLPAEYHGSMLWNCAKNHFDITSPSVSDYINYSIYQKGEIELFDSQKVAISKVLGSESGGVVCLPTSGGKTKVAELLILDALTRGEKALYIAPYRSLAFELENSFVETFSCLDFKVTNLYGGAVYTADDKEELEQADLIICTPEKSKALFRYNPELFADIACVIIDEGHLLGDQDRYIKNEIFFDEFKYRRRSNCKFIVLSAVLPNNKDISEWFTGSDENAVESDWRPADSRFGIFSIQPNGANSMTWYFENRRKSAVSNILEAQGREDNATLMAKLAVKLAQAGSVLLYVQKTNEVLSKGEKCCSLLSDDFVISDTNTWSQFELVCEEHYGSDSRLYNCARRGVFCHSARLPKEVRLCMERLMRSEHPRIIVSTSTLAQGVNLGVSTVIVSDTSRYVGGEWDNMKPSDFRNLAGRAGRSFTDFEGKTIIVFDETKIKNASPEWVKDNKIAEPYFYSQTDRAESGCLAVLLKTFAHELALEKEDFTVFIEKICSNSYAEDLAIKGRYEDCFDYFDDTLLSLLQVNNLDTDDMGWLLDFFARSLMYIECKYLEDAQIKQDRLNRILISRAIGLKQKLNADSGVIGRKVSSSIPFRADTILDEKMTKVIELVDKYQTDEDLGTFFCSMIEHLYDVPVSDVNRETLPLVLEVAPHWIKGESVIGINGDIKKILNITESYFNFSFPWILNAIARKMDSFFDEDRVKLITSLSTLVQYGLPDKTAVKVYKAGIHSRPCATEIAQKLNFEGEDLRSIKIMLRRRRNLDSLSVNAQKWIQILRERNSKERSLKRVQNKRFSLDVAIDRLYPVAGGERTYLVDETLSHIYEASEIVEPIYAKVKGAYFKGNKKGAYRLKIDNPFYKIEEDYELR